MRELEGGVQRKRRVFAKNQKVIINTSKMRQSIKKECKVSRSYWRIEVMEQEKAQQSRGKKVVPYMKLRWILRQHRMMFTNRFFVIDKFGPVCGVAVSLVPRELMGEGGEVPFRGI